MFGVCFLAAAVRLVDSPSPYYYLLPDTWVLIPCLAELVDPDSITSPLTLNATFFRNSTPINVYYPPPHHIVSVDRLENVVALGVAATGQDNHTLYHCEVAGLISPTTRIFVGGKCS